MGMYNTCNFERFSITDVEKFQRRIIKWCKEECLPGISMLIFDKGSLNVGGEPKVLNEEEKEYYKVVLSNISFTYTCIANSNMCVMYRIWENHNNIVMYNMPSKWENTELWLCV